MDHIWMNQGYFYLQMQISETLEDFLRYFSVGASWFCCSRQWPFPFSELQTTTRGLQTTLQERLFYRLVEWIWSRKHWLLRLVIEDLWSIHYVPELYRADHSFKNEVSALVGDVFIEPRVSPTVAGWKVLHPDCQVLEICRYVGVPRIFSSSSFTVRSFLAASVGILLIKRNHSLCRVV